MIEILKSMEVLFKLPPLLLVALCSTESDFRSNINPQDGGSPSYGQCQMKESTARMLGYSGTPVGLLDPTTNAFYAAIYLRHQYRRYDNIEAAVASYNSGSLRLASDGSIRNQRYVTKVIERWNSYRSTADRKLRNRRDPRNCSENVSPHKRKHLPTDRQGRVDHSCTENVVREKRGTSPMEIRQ